MIFCIVQCECSLSVLYCIIEMFGVMYIDGLLCREPWVASEASNLLLALSWRNTGNKVCMTCITSLYTVLLIAKITSYMRLSSVLIYIKLFFCSLQARIAACGACPALLKRVVRHAMSEDESQVVCMEKSCLALSSLMLYRSNHEKLFGKYLVIIVVMLLRN
jgi:hypothetical protein